MTDDGLAMIFDISKGNVKSSSSKIWLSFFFVEDLVGNSNGVRILSLSPGRDTQQKN